MALVTTKIAGLWVAKQTAKGSPAAAAIKRLRQVTGNVRTARSDGNEQFTTDDRFGDRQYFVDTVIGEGDPGVQAQPGTLAYLAYLFGGQESVNTIMDGPSAITDVEEHVITPAAAGGFWTSWWKKVGTSPDIIRERSADAKIGNLVLEGSTGQKVVRMTPNVMALDPGEKVAADPAQAFDDEDSFVYTEGESQYQVNDTVIEAHSQFNVALNENLAAVYTDAVTPLGLQPGSPEVTLGTTLALDEEGLQIYNRELYGNTSPAAGTKPLHELPVLGAYEFLIRRGQALEVDLDAPSAGDFTITYDGETTAAIAYDATPAAVQAAIEDLANVEPGDLTVEGTAADVYFIVFYRKRDATVTADFTGLTDGAGTALTDHGAYRSFKLEVPGVRWTPDVAVAPNPAGGLAEVSLAGGFKAVSGSPVWRITVRNGDAAYA